MNSKAVPVRKGDEVSFVVEGFGIHNDPVGKVEGFVVFLQLTDEQKSTMVFKKGQTVNGVIKAVAKNCAFAKIEEVGENEF